MAATVHRWLRITLLALLLVLAAGAAVVWMKRPLDVDVVEARYAPLVRTLQFAARVEALSRVDVGSTVTGRVEKVLVREGDAVRAGAPLVELEPAEWRAALAQAQASRARYRVRCCAGRPAAPAQHRTRYRARGRAAGTGGAGCGAIGVRAGAAAGGTGFSERVAPGRGASGA